MEINLKDLTKKVLLQWRLIVVGILVLAIALTVLGGVQSKRKADAAREIYAAQEASGLSEAERVTIPKVTLVSPKMMLLGAVLGCFAAVGVVCVQYVMSGRLRCESDLADGLSVSVLGAVSNGSKKKVFLDAVDRAVEKLFEGRTVDGETKIRIIATDITMAAKAKGLTSLYFTGNGYLGIADEVAEAMKESGVGIASGELAIYSPERLAEMLQSSGVVLFERVGVSRFADIKKELAYCERYSIPVIGSVVIE